METHNITIVGGSGIVGREFLKILDEQNTQATYHPSYSKWHALLISEQYS